MTLSSLQAASFTVQELFDSNNRYVVPIYQRNYAWQLEQIQQLIDDIYDACAAASAGGQADYFLGSLIVTAIPSSTHTSYEVVDGQQRLTTLHMLLTTLGASDAAVSRMPHQDCLQYASRPHASNALHRLVNSTLTDGTLRQPAAASEDNAILNGYNTIQQYLQAHPQLIQPGQRKQFAQYLKERVRLVRTELPAKTDLNRYFEIMNTRGQQLQQVDIIKARLMGCLPASEQACFAWIWNACAEMDSYVQMSLTPNDTGKRTRIFGNDWRWLQVSDFSALSSIHQSTHAAVLSAAETSAAQPPSLQAALTMYARSNTAINNSLKADTERFSSIISFSAFLLHALKLMEDPAGKESENEAQLDDKHLIKRFNAKLQQAMPAADKQDWVHRFVMHLLKLRNLFDAYVLKREYTNRNGEEGDWSLKYLRRSTSHQQVQYTSTGLLAATTSMHDSKQGETDVDGDDTHDAVDLLQLQSMLRITYTAPRGMHWITEALRFLMAQSGAQITTEPLAQHLRDYARQKVKAAFFPRPDSLEHPQGFAIARIVFTYLDYLLLQQACTPDAKSYRFGFRTSIEHFGPQNPGEDQSAKLDPDCLHLLGNLALIRVRDNSKFSNNPALAKAQLYTETIQQSPKLQRMAKITIEQALKNPTAGAPWTEQQVLDHHNEMLQLLKQDLFPET